MDVFEINNLAFTYEGEANKVLSKVTLNVRQGDFILLCGKSGCGKSTLLRLLKGSIAPRGNMEGSIIFMGKKTDEMSKAELASKIAFVMQNPDNQIICDDVYSELCFTMSQLGFSRELMGRKVFEVANYFGINHYLDMDIDLLSGGQKQLLTVAAALCTSPDVLLLDEPTASLDPNSKSLLLSALEKINKELGMTVIIAEQNIDAVYPCCNKIAAMENGALSFVCEKKQVSENLKAYSCKAAFPVYVRAYSEMGERVGNCPGNMNEAKKWIERFKGEKAEQKPLRRLDGEKAIESKNLWLRFEKNGRDVLKGVDISLKKGEISCILGANGSGKSTLLKALTGIKKCYEGSVKVFGSVSMVCQNPLDVFTYSTVGEEFKERDDYLFNLFEITELMDMHPYDLSGGEVQRVAVTKAIMQKTDVLILDEITKGMGEEFKSVLGKELIRQSKERGLAVLLSSHDIDFCAEYTDTCHLLFNGAVAAKGRTREIIRDNDYYTTKARILTKGVFENTITNRDVIELCRLLKTR